MPKNDSTLVDLYADLAERNVSAAFRTFETFASRVRPLEAAERVLLAQAESGAILTARKTTEAVLATVLKAIPEA